MFRSDALSGERILITGGGTGLGRAMAEAFLGLGASVLIAGRRAEVLERTAAELGEALGRKPDVCACDIRNAEDVETMIETAWAQGPLTGLVNNAAGNFIARTEDLSHRAFDAVASTVFHGTFYVTLALGKKWIAAGRPGNVVSIVVTWVKNGGPFCTPSAMSKAGIDAMTKSLAVEWGRYGIRLNAIAPGLIPTEGMWSRLGGGRDIDAAAKDNPMGRLGAADELARLAAFLLSPRGCAFLNGETIVMDGANALATGGNFYGDLKKLSADDWQAVRAGIDAKTKGR